MISDNLRRYLKSRGITQSYVARSVDIPISSLNAMLSGRQKIPADLFFEICHVLEINPLDLANVKEVRQ